MELDYDKYIERLTRLIRRRDSLRRNFGLTLAEDIGDPEKWLSLFEDDSVTPDQLLDALEAHIAQLEASRAN